MNTKKWNYKIKMKAQLTKQKSNLIHSCWLTSIHIMTNSANILSGKYSFQEQVEFAQILVTKQFTFLAWTMANEKMKSLKSRPESCYSLII